MDFSFFDYANSLSLVTRFDVQYKSVFVHRRISTNEYRVVQSQFTGAIQLPSIPKLLKRLGRDPRTDLGLLLVPLSTIRAVSSRAIGDQSVRTTSPVQ